jgi:hypothetical protein
VLSAAAFTLLLCAPAAATAATRWVNDDAANYVPPGMNCANPGYAAIQAAVDAASAGDVIKVCPGVYAENVVIGTSNLTIASTMGAAATLVKPSASAYVFAIGAPGVSLRGFTIVAAGVDDLDIGVNVAVEGDTRTKVLQNVIFGGRIGLNLGCVSFGSQIASNTINGQTEAGINIDTCEAPPFPGTHHNSIHHNIACSQAAAGSIAFGGSVNRNQVRYNIATSITLSGTGNVVRYNATQLPIVDSGSGNTVNNNIAEPGVCPAALP